MVSAFARDALAAGDGPVPHRPGVLLAKRRRAHRPCPCARAHRRPIHPAGRRL